MVRLRIPTLFFLFIAAPASATLIPVTSEREVSVSARSSREYVEPETITDADAQTSLVPGAFSAFVDSQIAREGAAPLSTAEQTSQVGGGGVTATGSASALGTGFSDEFDGASSGGVSRLDLIFDLAAPTPYAMALTFAAGANFLDQSTGFFFSELTLGLDGGAPLIDIRCDLVEGFGPEITCFDQTEICATSFDPTCGEYERDGVLAAGRYALSLQASAGSLGSSSDGTSSYDLALVVPEPRRLVWMTLAGVFFARRRLRR